MNPFVRTTHTTHPLLKMSKMVAVLLLIFFPAIALANPVFQSSSNNNSNPSAVGSQSMQYQPESYQMASTSNYQVSTTISPAQTVYAPFSDENPSNGPSRISGRKNGDDIEWNEGEWGENADPGKQENSFPIGDAWSLLIFAAVGAGVIYIKQRKAEAKG